MQNHSAGVFRELQGISLVLVTLAAAAMLALSASLLAEPATVDIGSRLELFVDQHRIESMRGVRLQLHPPRPAEVVLRFDKPWEGRHSAYVTVLKDGDRYRMYYRGWPAIDGPDQVCYAESLDGIHWVKPDLGLVEWQGSKRNNILWNGIGRHNFTPFVDTRPGVPPSERYKAVGRGLNPRNRLWGFVSADGIHWRTVGDEPVITDGKFDSQNLAFWDRNRNKYVAYFRTSHRGVRAIGRAESDDFRHWSPTTPIELGDTPPEHFYTNATLLYFRAPHYYFAFPKRFNPQRKRLDWYHKTGISEAVVLSSRDGLHFDRTFMQTLIRPGRDERNWGDRSSMPAWGLHQTASDEMSLYYSQHYGFDTAHMRRGVFRLDGIASAHAGYEGGELVTKPLLFEGRRLILNYATSASGSVRVEVQEINGKPIPGFALADAPELYGDAIAEPYTWTSGADVDSLAGKPVRLRFVLKDTDLYSYRFGD